MRKAILLSSSRQGRVAGDDANPCAGQGHYKAKPGTVREIGKRQVKDR